MKTVLQIILGAAIYLIISYLFGQEINLDTILQGFIISCLICFINHCAEIALNDKVKK